MTKYSRLIIVLLCVGVIWLGYISINSNKETDLDWMSSELNASDWSQQKLELVNLEQQKILEFMVWPQERLKVLKQSILVTQELINREPTRTRYWKNLLNYQYELSNDPEKISWILEKVYKLEGWNYQVLIALTRYCVPFIFDEKLNTPLICNKIIRHLPLQDKRSQLARRIGISLEDLEKVMQHNKGA